MGLDVYDVIPEGMKAYLRHYGKHFNKKACDYAISLMRTKNASTGKLEKVAPMGKDEVEDLLKRAGITLEDAVLYDHVYVANMCKADYLRSAIPDEAHLARFVKDTIDDADAADGQVFNRWYADMCNAGMPIEWEDLV